MKHLFIFIAVLAILLGCSIREDYSGGSDHPNEITGQAIKQDIQSQSPLVANLYPLEPQQIPSALMRSVAPPTPIVRNDTCDTLGQFRFINVIPGTYRIEILSTDSAQVVLSNIIHVTDRDTIRLSPMQMVKSTSIWIRLEPGSSIVCDSRLELQGTLYSPTLNANGLCVFPFAPAGMEFQLVQQMDSTVTLGTIQALVDSTQDTVIQVITPNGIESCPTTPQCNSSETPVTLLLNSYGCLEQWRCDLSDTNYFLARQDTLLYGTPQLYIDSSNHSDTLSLSINDLVELRLITNGSTGFFWSTPERGTSLLFENRNVAIDTTIDTMMVGESSWRVIRIKALSKQFQPITWYYSRTDSTEAIDTFMVYMDVQ